MFDVLYWCLFIAFVHFGSRIPNNLLNERKSGECRNIPLENSRFEIDKGQNVLRISIKIIDSIYSLRLRLNNLGQSPAFTADFKLQLLSHTSKFYDLQ